MEKNIPVYQPRLLGNERRYVNECLDTMWISSKGGFINRFECEFGKYIDAPFSTTVSNGTVALHLALMALEIGVGDEVIVPTFTYIASVNAVSYVGASPVFVDANPYDWNINVSQIEKKITSRTKAIMAVHLYGAMCQMDELVKICKKYSLYLIEDVAEAFGSKFKGKYAGTFGDISTFSFFGNKTITTGEGGMLVSKSSDFIKRAAYLKSQAVSITKEYWHDEIGYNYRMTNICAAIGLAQIEKADEIIDDKRRIAEWYRQELEGLDFEMQEEVADVVHSYWMFSILAKNNELRNHLRIRLMEAGVETRPLFPPVHMMPAFRINESFPVAENISSRGLNLPSFPSLTRLDIVYICKVIRLALH